MKLARWIWLTLAVCVAAPGAWAWEGRVHDAVTGQPVPNATVVIGTETLHCDAQGRFQAAAALEGMPVAARAPGYARYRGAAGSTIALKPMRPKALYLSAYGIGSAKLRGDALKLIDETELNALVIDVKGDRGIVPYRSAALAAAGAQAGHDLPGT
jgi:hypothetical protein